MQFLGEAVSQMVRLRAPEAEFSVCGLIMLQLPESLLCAGP